MEWLRLKVGRNNRLTTCRRFGAYQRGSHSRGKVRETDAETFADEKPPKLSKSLQQQSQSVTKIGD